MKISAMLVLVALLVGASGCVAVQEPRHEVIAHGAQALPAGTIEDWVTYGDKLVEFRAVAESRVPPTRAEIDRGEGLIGRRVDLRIGTVQWNSAQPRCKRCRSICDDRRRRRLDF